MRLYKLRHDQMTCHKIFSSWDTESIKALADHARPYVARTGHVFFKEGQKGDNMYIMLKGSVIVAKSKTQNMIPDKNDHLNKADRAPMNRSFNMSISGCSKEALQPN